MRSRLALLAFVALPCVAAPPDALPSRAEILSLLHRADDWQSAHLIMPADDRNWERATWYTGVMSAWKETKDRKFFDQALAWGRQHKWQVGTEQDGSNRLFCVETWLELYFVEHDRAKIEPAIRWLATPAPNSPAGPRRWYLEDNRAYVDSLYGAPAFAMLAKATGDKKYLEIMQAFFDEVSGELMNKDVGLFYRDNRFIGKKTANGRNVFWSRGNGWVFGGIARILEYLPEDHPARPEYVRIFRRMAAELTKRQGPDGLWFPNLDDREALPTPETSGSGFFCYGLAWGINHGVLDRTAYLPTVQKAWAGLARSLSPEGKVRWGQQVDDQPHSFGAESTHEYVTGTFMLAGSQVYRLAR